MDGSVVKVSSFRDPVRKSGVTLPEEEERETKIKKLIKTIFNIGPTLTGPSVHNVTSPTHLKSPNVLATFFDQSSSRYRYLACIHIKPVVLVGLLIDFVLILLDFVVAACMANRWRALMVTTDEVGQGEEADGWLESSTVEQDSFQSNLAYSARLYESYMVETLVDGLLATVAFGCLVYGVIKNKPNFILPEISWRCVTVGVKIIQLSKQVSSGVATPFMISMAVVTMCWSIWFAHALFLYRRYVKDRRAFITAHSQF